MDGQSEMVLPSKVSRQSVGESWVETSRPHPQQQRCMAVAYSIEM
jgi:hypothetical protein